MAFDALNSVFCQLTVFGSIFVLFLSDLGLNKARIGVVLSLIPFAGICAIFLAPLSARLGVKRVFVSFWATRNVFVGGVLAAPWVAGRYGSRAAFLYVAGMMACFSLCRAFGEAANAQWRQDIIPHKLRGRFAALDGIVCTLAGVTAVFLAGWVIRSSWSIWRYVAVMAAGVATGFASVYWAWRIPGGLDARPGRRTIWHLRRFGWALRDRNFLIYMTALSLVTFGSAPLGVFVPLFLKEKVGVAPANVVLLQNGVMIGMLLSGYLWGWTADRYGSKPVILSGLGLLLAPPLAWLVIPYGSAWSVPIAAAVMVVGGMAAAGYALGTGRQLYVSIVPPRRKTHYMSVFCAWMGATGGLGQVLAGQSMTLARGASGTFLGLSYNPYTFLFLFSIAMLICGLVLQRRVRVDGAMPVRSFVGMFFQGNPLMAVDSLLRYHLAGREADRVEMIRRLGRAGSPLSVDRLADALEDPSFAVRYEAILAIARTRGDPTLTGDLIETLMGAQNDLSLAAAWALGRMGQPEGIAPLRWAFTASSRLLRLRAARALAALGDRDILDALRHRATAEDDPHLRAGYQDTLEILQAGVDRAALVGRLARLRRTRSVPALLAALRDRDFYVRFEAIIAASQRRHPVLTAELIRILLEGRDDVSVEAAWALSRIGDPSAVEPLMQTFHSDYALLAARSARALAALGEGQVAGEMVQRLDSPLPPGLRIAYASALGQLRVRKAVRHLIALHPFLPGGSWISELNLALARLVGQEQFFIRLWRNMRGDLPTGAATALHRLCARSVTLNSHEQAGTLARQCVQALAREDLQQGAALLADVLGAVESAVADNCTAAIMRHCRECLRQGGPGQTEAIPLAIHCLKSLG